MKKLIISAFLLCSVWTGYSQIGIGNPTPDRTSILDLKSANKGLLIPRVSLTGTTDVTTITGGVYPESLIVYNESDANIPKGFYFWKKGATTAEDKWVSLSDSSNSLEEALTELGLKEVTITYPNVKGVDSQILSPIITYKDEKGAVNDVPLFTALRNSETVTLLEKETIVMHEYIRVYDDNGTTVTENGYTADPTQYASNSEYSFTGLTKEGIGYTYYNEKGVKVSFNGSDLVSPGSETLTSLSYDSANKTLVYVDENKHSTTIDLEQLVGNIETITKLELVLTGGSAPASVALPYLHYTSEDKLNPNTYLSLKDLIVSAWKDVATKNNATSADQQIFTNKWVGIGYDVPSANALSVNERLRVNGSISATDSYYADYVFEDYFDGSSAIKEDYSFKSLKEVEDYITVYRHLPGITPISELEKTDTGYSFNVSKLSVQLLEKTEELYLHVLEQNKELKAKDLQLNEMSQMILDLQKSLLDVKEQIKNINK